MKLLKALGLVVEGSWEEHVQTVEDFLQMSWLMEFCRWSDTLWEIIKLMRNTFCTGLH